MKSKLGRRSLIGTPVCILLALAGVLGFCILPTVVHADAPPLVVVTASPDIVLADGRSSSTITAHVTGSGGGPVADGVVVRFSATLGALSAVTASTSGGIARVVLTSSSITGTSTVFANYNSGGVGAQGQTDIVFTNDASLVNKPKDDADWMRVRCKAGIDYYEDSRVVEALASDQGVALTYGKFHIDADDMQVDLQSDVIRARNATITQGGKVVVVADFLYYQYTSDHGWATVSNMPGYDKTVTTELSGVDIKVQVSDSAAGRDVNFYKMRDVSGDHYLAKCSALDVRPHSTIQIRQATLYCDDKRIVSLALQVLSVGSSALFGQTVLGYGTDGVYVNVPYYIAASAVSTDTVYVRSDVAEQQSGMVTRDKSLLWFDFAHAYSFGHGSASGNLQLLQMQRNIAMGIEWRHSQQFSRHTGASFSINYPDRNDISYSEGVHHDMGSAGISDAASYSYSKGSTGLVNEQSGHTDSLAFKQHRLWGTPAFGLSTSTTINASISHQTEEYAGQKVATSSQTYDLSQRFNTSPMRMIGCTVADSFQIGTSYDAVQGNDVTTYNGDLSATRSLSSTSSTTLTYNYTHNPQNKTIVYTGTSIYTTEQADLHRFGAVLGIAPKNSVWDIRLFATRTVPTQDWDASAQLNYHIGGRTRFTLANTQSVASGLYYQDYSVIGSYAVVGREMSLSWAAVTHMVRFNMEAIQF